MAQAKLQVESAPSKSIGEKIAVLTVVVVPFIATIYAITLLWQRYVSWSDIALMIILYMITGLGITVGYHRLLTHRSFETHKPIKGAFLIMGAMALEGPPITWASTHIEHHAHSDQEGDPHSPMKGLWHSHVGWLFDHAASPDKYGAWLTKDPVNVFVNKTWWVWVILTFVLPFMIGGWTGLLWGGLVRIFLTHHITWSVNSICHIFGNRPYKTRDVSRNNWIVGLLAFGEGWHNNHHAFPRSAFHGLRWWQIDTSAYIIRALEATGLAWNVQRVKPEDQRKRSNLALEMDV
ncbi:MAG: acyl-CoA desaturase [Chloroflexi bacterium AL-W]|nr:acyl-CoA desaturase [Chloroflexi bacterium AL-N1]NOK70850.1 acyl-CoA desaturase [Chloroflexi bacterium AL-N10]NOK78410.1 acyl-CoA desaturase [Chloroflexi bacterium AL-N5]NOK85391.1 acyl-CoA desaturase [Chloroflexi bacterium AL-W]NOK92667.1 acyl-CoA desaturase [Chloroflexi bacterium AL-N15]